MKTRKTLPSIVLALGTLAMGGCHQGMETYEVNGKQVPFSSRTLYEQGKERYGDEFVVDVNGNMIGGQRHVCPHGAEIEIHRMSDPDADTTGMAYKLNDIYRRFGK